MNALRMGALFAGYEGVGLGLRQVLDVELAWVSEIEAAPSRILAHHYPDVPNHGDITAVDWSVIEPVDVLTGGFPCQDISAAGKRAGLKPGTRTGLWSHMAEAIDQLRPRLVVAENVRGLLSAEAHSPVEPCPWCLGDGPASGLRALGAVLGDLADIGYDARWCGLRAADVGAPHGRWRVFVVAWPAAHADRDGLEDVGRIGSLGRHADGRDGAREAATHAGRDRAAAHAERGGRLGRPRQPFGCEVGRTAAAGSGEDAAADAGGARLGQLPGGAPSEEARPRGSDIATDHRGTRPAVDWGPYQPAIERWERVLGRIAPPPTEPSRTGSQRLSPRFVEWMQGLEDGWVTDVPGISRNDQLKALGNGCVPQQVAAAMRIMLRPVGAVAA